MSALAGAIFLSASTFADVPSSVEVPPNSTTIVLVHGAFEDGSSWARVIPLLQAKGHHVIAVQNNLTSQASDVASPRRVIEAQSGPVIVVGHSYGGVVITSAAAGNPNVKALVYITAFAPEPGEVLGELIGKFSPSDLGAALQPDSAGFLFINPTKLRALIAQDVTEQQAAIMAATQKPIAGAAFSESINQAAWKDIPSWFLVTTQDHAIKPELQRFMAERIHAHTIELDSSHVPFLSHPDAVADFILSAAQSIAPRTASVTQALAQPVASGSGR